MLKLLLGLLFLQASYFSFSQQQIDYAELKNKIQNESIIDAYYFSKVYKACEDSSAIIALHHDIDLLDLNLFYSNLNEIAYAEKLSLLGMQDLALKTIHAVRDNISTKHSNVVLAEYYRVLSRISLNTGEPNVALKFALKAKESISDSSNIELLQSTYASIGIAYNALRMPKKAKVYFKEALNLEQSGQNRNSLYLQLNLAVCEVLLGNTEESKRIFKDALPLIKLNKDKFAELRTYSNLGELYFNQDSLTEGHYYFDKAIEVSRDNGQVLDQIRLFTYKSKLYHKENNYQLALSYLLKADSIQKNYNGKEDYAKQILEFESNRIIELEKKHLNLLEEQKNQEAKLNRILIVALIVVTVLLFLGIFLMIKINFKNRLILKNEVKQLNDQVKVHDSKHDEIINNLEKLIGEKEIFKDNNLTIEKLSKKLGSNRSYVSEAINSYYGMSFSNWLNNLRVRESEKLLLDEKYTAYSIEAIAEMVGFSSISSYNSNFKRITGLTPSYFRNNANK